MAEMIGSAVRGNATIASARRSATSFGSFSFSSAIHISSDIQLNIRRDADAPASKRTGGPARPPPPPPPTNTTPTPPPPPHPPPPPPPADPRRRRARHHPGRPKNKK